MTKKAILVLEDGSVYEGYTFGAECDTVGEVVFNTSMAGYQEILTDPSYAGQIVVPTYPLIGNYGTNNDDFESNRVQVRGFVVREQCEYPSHFLCTRTIDAYLKDNQKPGIYGVDTRAITRKLRSVGVMRGMITTSLSPDQAVEEIRRRPDYDSHDFVKEVSTAEPYRWGKKPADPAAVKVVAYDCGLKFYICRILESLGCDVTVMPCTSTAADILALNPDGILLTPGPGNPELLDYAVNTVKGLIGKKPIMGICLGNQLIGRAFGGKTYKLKYGHRGGNHPVVDIGTGQIHITAQNHGFALDPDTLPKELEISHVNLNDGTVEGLKHRELPIFAIQYHSEASPGPMDSIYLFEQFVQTLKDARC